jgi:signal peptidase II
MISKSDTSVARGALPWLWLSAGVIGLDQFTKMIVIDALELSVPHPVIPGFLNWTLAFNTGAAFSFLADQQGWQRWVFTGIAVVVASILTSWLARTPRGEWRTALPLALLIGGALGNLIDRVRFGHVTDFIQVYYQQWAFPSFNVADSSISIGAVLLVWFGLFAHARTATPTSSR